MTADILLYLLYCAANDASPDAAVTERADLNELYRLASVHSVAAPVALTLERAGVQSEEFNMYLSKSLRRLFLLDHEREEIIKRFEEKKIRYCPLKGIILKDIYGEPGLREMSDNDILIDAERGSDVRVNMRHTFSNNESFRETKI